jgi:hypothetical protein
VHPGGNKIVVIAVVGDDFNAIEEVAAVVFIININGLDVPGISIGKNWPVFVFEINVF